MDAGTTVLVAEDSPTQALRIQCFLEAVGFDVVVTENGRAALEMIRKSPPDLLLTDLNMPVMDGAELVAAAHAEFPELPIVLATTEGSESMAADALRNGALSYVPKRFLDDLVPTLQRLLAIAHSNQGSNPANANGDNQYCLTNDETLLQPLVVKFSRLIQRYEIRNSSGALRIAVALDEALRMAIVHGNLELPYELRESDVKSYNVLETQHRQQAPYKDRVVHVRASWSAQSAQFVIRDAGPGFNPLAISDPTAPAHLVTASGRGRWLIHAFMDEVRYNEQGNEITMVVHKRTT